MSDLVLYQFPSCPFCARVLSFIKQNSLDVQTKNTMSDPGARQELMQIGGKTQVPCLVIDGKPMYESMDIINWLDKNLVK